MSNIIEDRIVGIYSNDHLDSSTRQDVFMLLQNNEGMVYGYLPYYEYPMSLTKEEMDSYKDGTFANGLTTLSYEQYINLLEG